MFKKEFRNFVTSRGDEMPRGRQRKISKWVIEIFFFIELVIVIFFWTSLDELFKFVLILYTSVHPFSLKGKTAEFCCFSLAFLPGLTTINRIIFELKRNCKRKKLK